jgi:hypothetical protein
MNKLKNDEYRVRRPSRTLALILIGVGVIFLLTNIGLFSIGDIGAFFGQIGGAFGSFFGNLGGSIGRLFGGLGELIGRFWPLILIGIGLLLIVRRPSHRRIES